MTNNFKPNQVNIARVKYHSIVIQNLLWLWLSPPHRLSTLSQSLSTTVVNIQDNTPTHVEQYFNLCTLFGLIRGFKLWLFFFFWQNPLITPVVTPRFVLSCTSHLLKKLGHIAKKYDVPIQVHFLKQNVIRLKRGFMPLDLSRTANCLLKSKIISMANITLSLALK